MHYPRTQISLDYLRAGVKKLKGHYPEFSAQLDRLLHPNNRLLDILTALDKNYILLVHQTDTTGYNQIMASERFVNGAGTVGTALLSDPGDITQTLQKMQSGKTHRGSDHLVILCVPRNLFPSSSSSGGGRVSHDTIDNYFLDTCRPPGIPQNMILGGVDITRPNTLQRNPLFYPTLITRISRGPTPK